jgi:hypothetical protein
MSLSQREAVYLYIQEHGSITQMEALMHLGCFRLSARILELREEGHDIATENERDNGKTYARYRYHSRKLNQQSLFST